MTTTPPMPTDDSPPQDKVPAEPAYPRPSMAFLLIVTIVTLVLDLGSKHWVTTRLDEPSSYGRSVKIIDGVLSFISAKNRGGAWGLL